MIDYFRKFRKWGKCNCKTLQEYQGDPNCPIRYDIELNEYNIVYGNSNIRMYFCFFCGGKLPESKRGDLFTKPSKYEMVKAFNIIRKTKTEEDIVKMLGPPDKKLSINDFGPEWAEPQPGWIAQYTYYTKWKTLEIIFQVYENGKVEGSVVGKYIGKEAPTNGCS